MGLRDLFKRAKTDNLNWEVSKGNVSTHKAIFKFGENASVGAIESTLWDEGGIYNYIASPQQLKLSSTDPDDTISGTGAQKIVIFGNDTNYNLQSEEIELNGLTPVLTEKIYLRIWRMIVTQAGASLGAEGIVYAGTGIVDGAGVPANIHAQIDNGNNQTLMCLFTIPKGYSGLLINTDFSVGEGKTANIRFVKRELGKLFTIQTTFRAIANVVFHNFDPPLLINEFSDIEFRATSAAPGTEVSGDFSLVIFQKDRFATDFVRHQDLPLGL
jgi:hypothetical protein